jgi:hypothetical protein
VLQKWQEVVKKVVMFLLKQNAAYAAPLDTPEKSFRLLGMLPVIRLNTMISTTPNGTYILGH